MLIFIVSFVQTNAAMSDTPHVMASTSRLKQDALSSGFDDGLWDIQTVDMMNDRGAYTDIVLSDEGDVFISYYDLEHGDLKLAQLVDNAWSTVVVDSEGNVGEFSCVALDSQSYPHVCYLDATNNNIKYASWTGTTWENTIIHPDNMVKTQVSFLLDASGTAHLAFYDYSTGNLFYSWNDGSTWEKERVPAVERTGFGVDLVLDAFDDPHLSYIDEEGNHLYYAYRTDGEWSTTLVDEDSQIFGSTALALDTFGRPHICYYDVAGEKFSLKHAFLTDNGWTIEIVDPGLRGFWWELGVSLAIDSFNRLHVAYYYWPTFTLNYAMKYQDHWRIETVDANRFAGAYPSLTLDSLGYPCISYMDGSMICLKYAKKVQFAPDCPAKPLGASITIKGKSYEYSTQTSDFDGDTVRYGWDWDGDYTIDEWTSFFPSDTKVTSAHSWDTPGNYEIRVTAEDSHGNLGDWSEPLMIHVYRGKTLCAVAQIQNLQGSFVSDLHTLLCSFHLCQTPSFAYFVLH
jgi:catechol 2,3-dioxygenase-like lactoylglutathione lyase family enzyme